MTDPQNDQLEAAIAIADKLAESSAGADRYPAAQAEVSRYRAQLAEFPPEVQAEARRSAAERRDARLDEIKKRVAENRAKAGNTRRGNAAQFIHKPGDTRPPKKKGLGGFIGRLLGGD